MEPQFPVNKDLILREKLAIERTVMANDRTFLSFIRTALYFAIAGLSLHQLMPGVFGPGAAIAFFVLAGMVLATGIYKYGVQLQKIKESRKLVGGYHPGEAKQP